MKKLFTAVFGLLFFIYGAVCSAYSPEGKVFVTVLDIGQGDAFLIETPTQNVLLDTGDVGTRNRLVSKLKDAGITRFERVILTHPHADHIGGVSAVLDNFPVDLISDNGVASASPYFNYRDKVPCDSLKAGDILDLGGGVKFHVFYPPQSLVDSVNAGLQPSQPNRECIVGKLTFGELAVMFAADADTFVEDQLVESLQPQLKALILKAGHHGSKSSSSRDFVASVAPDFVFISAGKSNRFGHPHKDALAMFREFHVLPSNIFCTRFNGDIRVESDGKNNLIIVERENDWVEDYSGERVTVTRLD